MVVWLKQAKIDIWKFSLKNHISFYKVFFDKKHIKPTLPPSHHPSGKFLWQGLFKTPKTLIFFWSPYFQNLGLKIFSPAEREQADTVDINTTGGWGKATSFKTKSPYLFHNKYFSLWILSIGNSANVWFLGKPEP